MAPSPWAFPTSAMGGEPLAVWKLARQFRALLSTRIGLAGNHYLESAAGRCVPASASGYYKRSSRRALRPYNGSLRSEVGVCRRRSPHEPTLPGVSRTLWGNRASGLAGVLDDKCKIQKRILYFFSCLNHGAYIYYNLENLNDRIHAIIEELGSAEKVDDFA